MAKQAPTADSEARHPSGLASLTAAVPHRNVKGPAPVHLWNPPFCGDIDLRIAADGTWFYQGTPIGRPALVRLFASILRKDPDGFVLVTPIEKVGIQVDDAPFVAVEMEAREEEGRQTLHFRTNVEEWVTAGEDHPLRFAPGASGGLKPYVLVRAGLWALVKRAVFYDLVALGTVETLDGKEMFGVRSKGIFFPMAPAAEIGWTR